MADWLLLLLVVWALPCCSGLLHKEIRPRANTTSIQHFRPLLHLVALPPSIVSSLGFFPLPKRPGVSFSRWEEEEAPLLFSPRFQVLRKSNNIPFNRKMRFQFPVWEQFQRFHQFPNSMASIRTDCYTDISFSRLSFFFSFLFFCFKCL